MKRQAPKKIKDTIAIVLIFAIPFASSLFGETGLLGGLGMRAAELSAMLSMPEAGVTVMMDQVRSVVEEYSADPGYQPDDYVSPADDSGESLLGLSDIERAEATIPPENRGPIETAQYASHGHGDNYFDYGAGSIRNATNYSNSEMQKAADGALPFNIAINSKEPQVLIMHTHSTESYDPYDAGFYDIDYPTRSTDITQNINAVGKEITDTLNSLGINTIHATEYHDYPSYNNAYSRSALTTQSYLDKYPSIKIVLDIHRDGIQREDGTRIKPTAIIDGKKAAQIMIICGADDGSMDLPNFRENLKFAVKLQDSAESLYPGFTRPLYLAYRHYNQDLTTGSLLVEVGAESSTLAEAKYSGQLVARSLADTLKNQR